MAPIGHAFPTQNKSLALLASFLLRTPLMFRRTDADYGRSVCRPGEAYLTFRTRSCVGAIATYRCGIGATRNLSTRYCSAILLGILMPKRSSSAIQTLQYWQ